jgi:hypothetical protein
MLYTEYEAWFEGERNKLTLEARCTQVGPLWNVTPVSRPPWQVNWCVRFTDNKHLKVKESWSPRSLRLGGRGFRRHFAFHYGDLNPASDANGFPLRDPTFLTTIRIDTDAYGAHMHYEGRDHIYQQNVQGFNISNADLFEFIEAVQQHRNTGDPFHKILNFTVLP